MPTNNNDIIITSVAKGLSKQAVTRLGQALIQFERWDSLILDARREGLSGLLYRSLQGQGLLEKLPPPVAERLASAYYQTLRVNLQLMADIEKILRESSQFGIMPIILQGMSLQGDVYADPGVRPMSDIDLWIDASHFESFAMLLVQLGYIQDPLYPGSWARNATKLDIHTQLFWADRLKSRQWLSNVGGDHFLERTVDFAIGATTARRLNPIDQIFYLGMHALKHNVDRLIWLKDIAQLLDRMPEESTKSILGHAEAVGLTRQMGYVGFLLERLLGVKSALLPANGKVGSLAANVLRLRDKRNALPSWSPLVLFTAGKGWRITAMMLWEMVFPDPQILRQVFADKPTASPWRLYLYRIGQMLGMRR